MNEREDGCGSAFSFNHFSCVNTARNGGIFSNCSAKKYDLFRLFENEVDLRTTSRLDPNLRGQHDWKKFKSPTVILPYLGHLSKRVHVLSSRVRNAKSAIKALRRAAERFSKVEVNHDLLFEEQALREGYEKLMEQVDVREHEIFHILFQECMLVKRRIAEKGNARGHTYSPLLIRFAIMLRNKLSQSTYEQAGAKTPVPYRMNISFCRTD
jgi:hypothetical protein